jgi:predicted nucleic acid-binding protein
VGDRLEELQLAGKIWTCRVIDLELIYSARKTDVAKLAAGRRAFLEAPVTPVVMERALSVSELLAGRGQHRGAKPTDLIIAAAAEAQDLILLHYDDDYDRIAAVTGQGAEWIAHRGTLSH